MPARQIIAKFVFSQGYASDLPATEGNGYLRQGSRNLLVTGSGLLRPFKGLTLANASSGSRLHFLTDDGYSGLGDDETPGKGVVFQAINLLFFIGQGVLRYNGEKITISAVDVEATTQLQYLTRNGDTFDSGSTLLEVGHPRPSKPDLFMKSPPSAGQKTMNAAVTVAVWRADSNTGQTSLPSETSDILTLTNGSVIVVFPAADANGQDVWGIGVTLLGLSDLGNLYELPTDLGGEVLESTLAYNRTIASCTVTSGDKTVTFAAGTGLLASADVGRRIVRGTDLDSWIVSVTNPDECEVNDDATGNSTGSATITHAIDGILRAHEISWADTDLFGQALSPYQSFPPMDGFFCGNLMDCFYIEDVEGTIFYSLPNTFSFPRSLRRIYTEDKAVVYVQTGNGYHWRCASQSISQLYYAIGERPIQLNLKTKNLGCKYPQNASIGYDGRLMIWTGRPTIVSPDGSFNSTFHNVVSEEFDGWEDQTALQPIVTAYDPIGQYELWCRGREIKAVHAPSGRWCAPINIEDWIADASKVIVGQVIINERLHLAIGTSTDTGGDGEGFDLYEWNVGAGSDITAVSYHRDTPEEQTTVDEIKGVCKAGDSELTFQYFLIKNFTERIPLETDTVETSPEFQLVGQQKPNVRGCQTVAVEMTCVGANGKAVIDYIELWGEWNSSSNKE